MQRLKIRLGASVLIAILAPLWLAESKGDEPSALGTSGLSSARSPITETCLDQDKLPCTMETLYLLDADGSNATKIVVAYPFTERRTNAHNVSYFPAPHFTLPANHAIQTSNGLAAVPMGSNILLPKGSMGLGPARLVSVEKLKPTIPVPLPRRLGPPAITITEPKEGATRCPLIQLKGRSDQPLRSVRFDLINTSRQLLDHQGFVTDSYFDLALWKQTTNYFQCFDINLTPGTNTIVLRCEDLMGRVTTNTLIYELRLVDDFPLHVVRQRICGVRVLGFGRTGVVDVWHDVFAVVGFGCLVVVVRSCVWPCSDDPLCPCPQNECVYRSGYHLRPHVESSPCNYRRLNRPCIAGFRIRCWGWSRRRSARLG
jgi:hypothetical protein